MERHRDAGAGRPVLVWPGPSGDWMALSGHAPAFLCNRGPTRKHRFLLHFNDFVHCILGAMGQLAGPKVTYVAMPATCPSDLYDPVVTSGQVCTPLQGDFHTDTWAVSCDAQVPYLTKTAVCMLMTCLTDVRSP